jgi:hypothetical protein
MQLWASAGEQSENETHQEKAYLIQGWCFAKFAQESDWSFVGIIVIKAKVGQTTTIA